MLLCDYLKHPIVYMAPAYLLSRYSARSGWYSYRYSCPCGKRIMKRRPKMSFARFKLDRLGGV